MKKEKFCSFREMGTSDEFVPFLFDIVGVFSDLNREDSVASLACRTLMVSRK